MQTDRMVQQHILVLDTVAFRGSKASKEHATELRVEYRFISVCGPALNPEKFLFAAVIRRVFAHGAMDQRLTFMAPLFAKTCPNFASADLPWFSTVCARDGVGRRASLRWCACNRDSDGKVRKE